MMQRTRGVAARLVAWAGVAAAVGALAVGEVAALLVDRRSSPVVAVGGLVIDRVPPAGKELAIQLFGTNDKLALVVGSVLFVCLAGAALAIAARDNGWIGLAGFGLLGALAMVAAVTRAGATAAWALPGLLAAGAGMAVLTWLLSLVGVGAVAGGTNRTAAEGPDAEGDWPPDGEPVSGATRRRFLRTSGTLIGAGAVVSLVAHRFGQFSSTNAAREAVRTSLPEPSGGPAPSIPAADVADLHYETPNAEFYRIDTALVVPRVDPADWTLTIDGLVSRPITLTFEELLRRPMIERYITLTCVSNEVGGDLIGNARWLGVPVKALLEEAGPAPDADQVVSWSVDGFTAGTPTAALLDGRDALIAVGMNGEPLPLDHGFPVRMVVPGLYGYVSATKWLRRLELTRFADFDAYWVPRGWAQQAPIKTQSRIDRPRAGSTISAGTYLVAGVAWAQHRGISAVQVRVDGGAWQDATLAAVASIDTWRLWSWSWPATPGTHVLEVRAADNAGVPQTEARAAPAPDGATGYHAITVTVR